VTTMSTQPRTDVTDVYHRFLKALNAGDRSALREVMAPTFRDHHPSFDTDGLDAYLGAVDAARADLDLRADLKEVFAVGDRIVTRVSLTGTHRGIVLGRPATGRPVHWSTIEVWRVENGLLAERWAQDDLLGLSDQLQCDTENMALVRQVSEAVNARRLDDLDDLFADGFVDRNPAWTVTDLTQLKGIIRAAHEGLDFVARLDDIYPAPGDRVVIHITFTGRHVGTFFGREATGLPVTWTSIEVYRLAHGKVAERWVQADTTGLMAQLGVPLPD
jgi:predicted ester cyclase